MSLNTAFREAEDIKKITEGHREKLRIIEEFNLPSVERYGGQRGEGR